MKGFQEGPPTYAPSPPPPPSQVILADEPTTGLDSSQAQKVVHKIADIAKTKGITAILALHAPRGSIYEILDDVFLLAPNGIPIFIGPAASACQYFARLGHTCPPNSNIAEFLIDLVSVDTEDEEQATTDLARIQELAVAFRKEEARRQGKEEARRQGNEKGETREEGNEGENGYRRASQGRTGRRGGGGKGEGGKGGGGERGRVAR